jgi:hypothetical protein
VDAEFARLNFVLAAIPFDNISHTGENLSNKIAETLVANKFRVEKICGRLLNVEEF